MSSGILVPMFFLQKSSKPKTHAAAGTPVEDDLQPPLTDPSMCRRPAKGHTAMDLNWHQIHDRHQQPSPESTPETDPR